MQVMGSLFTACCCTISIFAVPRCPNRVTIAKVQSCGDLIRPMFWLRSGLSPLFYC